MNNEPSTVNSSQERIAQGFLEQETCKTSHGSTEVPDVSVDGIVASKDSGSQNSSSVQYEIQQNSSQPGSESGLVATPTSIANRKSKRLARYNRRGSKGVK